MGKLAAELPRDLTRSTRDVVVIGGSAGALPVALELLDALPADFPAAVFLALHGRANPDDSGLTASLQNYPLPVETARDGRVVEPGRVYVSVGDAHLLLEDGVIRVQHSPAENRFRPCLDVLFKSAAATYGRRVIGVLLSGAYGSDGTAGLWQIQHRGGLAIVQDPRDASSPGMPEAALRDLSTDYVLPGSRIGPALIALVCEKAGVPAGPARILIVEDESIVATNLQHSLAELGYEVIDWVPTGEAAIEMAGRMQPDVILMDIHLAGELDGIESARRIWQKTQIPVVYCTAHADLATLKAIHTTESYGYVMKPFQTAAVRAAIELALARREKELR